MRSVPEQRGPTNACIVKLASGLVVQHKNYIFSMWITMAQMVDHKTGGQRVAESGLTSHSVVSLNKKLYRLLIVMEWLNTGRQETENLLTGT